MSKTTAPLLSFGARGQIGNTMVFSTWKGIPYVRQKVIPANPRTTEQQETRNIFRTLSQMWSNWPAIGVEPWNAYAVGKPLAGRNAFMGNNTRFLRSTPPLTDLTTMQFSPGALGGPPPTSAADTPAATTITMDIVAPTPPTGWTLTAAQGVIVLDQDPADDFAGFVQAQEDLTSTYQLIFTGLTTATDYAVGVWLKWLKPNAQVAYSVSLTQIVTTS